jgi:hypothetical protein
MRIEDIRYEAMKVAGVEAGLVAGYAVSGRNKAMKVAGVEAGLVTNSSS